MTPVAIESLTLPEAQALLTRFVCISPECTNIRCPSGRRCYRCRGQLDRYGELGAKGIPRGRRQAAVLGVLGEEPISTADVARALQISQQHAGAQLRQALSRGLVVREHRLQANDPAYWSLPDALDQ